MKPLGGKLMNVCTKVLFQGPIKYLCLTIGLWVVSSAYSELGATQLEQFVQKITNKI